MTAKNKPNLALKTFKRTKIIATVGPSINSTESIKQLIESGVNGLMINSGDETYKELDMQIDWIRQASSTNGKSVAIVQDLQGPKLCLGDFDDIVTVANGQSLSFAYEADYERSGILPIQYDLSKKVKRGERLYLFDGKIKTVVTSVKDKVIHVRAENEGILIKRAGINVPDTDFEVDILTKKDKEDIAYGSVKDIDYVALSFVQTAEDIKKLRRILQNLGSSAKIIAKIETRLASVHLEEIVKEADVVMVARGNLVTETSSEEVPITQRRIIELGMKYAKPTIVSTQILSSMSESLEPSRAEVSDLVTTILIGTDAVMLCDETAFGKYPVESVCTIMRVITYTQSHALHNPVLEDIDTLPGMTRAIANATIDLARNVSAVAVIAETKSGATALHVASRRPNIPIIAVTSTARVAQQLALIYGTKSYIRPEDRLQATKLTNWLHKSKVLKKGDIVVSASGKYPGVIGTTDTIKVRAL